ncbi:unnamed protein product [Penicillium roqueforti FM164]|uniref:Genomic scaffold, ProqFM164S03 n=1 Tax=Penicillium roqueforti (strain FM164) TaxID=1365484 RepID=W6QYQ1_PENRF|nr:unnamed protein product [Penicillium roqueforti FM164]
MIFHGDSLVVLETLFSTNRDPNTFDGYLFVDPTTGACNISSTVTPTEKWLPFAIGASTCPGRLAETRITQVTVTATEKWLSFAIGASTCPGRLAGTRITQVMFAKILYG